MKLSDLIVEHFGSDKVMHFLGGAWILALATPFGWNGILVAFILAMVLSYSKEKWLDENFEWPDVLSAFCGCASTFLIYVVLTVWL